jgi:hypothetical protein
MRIHVTKNDIEVGIWNSAEMCPIALAVKRRTKKRPVRVGLSWIEIGPWNRAARIDLPPKAKGFILALGIKQPVAPFQFEIDDDVPL